MDIDKKVSRKSSQTLRRLFIPQNLMELRGFPYIETRTPVFFFGYNDAVKKTINCSIFCGNKVTRDPLTLELGFSIYEKFR